MAVKLARRVGLVGLLALVMALEHMTASAAALPNPSFETGDAGGPTGWIFTGPDEAKANAWYSDQPSTGKHFLRIDAHYHSQNWASAAIPVRSGQKYLLRWQSRFWGEKPWRFRAKFCGVEVSFKARDGGTLGSEQQHSSCWQTRGWQPGWLLFTTPAAAKTLVIRFAIETSESLPGGYDVDDLDLAEWPPASPPGQSNLALLALKIEDESGKPTAARVHIANSKGDPVQPPGAIVYEQAGGVCHPLEEGFCYAVVPHGPCTISVTKGFEYEPWEREIQLTQKAHKITVRLHRASDWRKRGWFCGDHHTHLYRHGGTRFPSLQWPDVMRAARCEGLDFLPFMGADVYPTEAKIDAIRRQSPRFAFELTEEITEDFWGHVCPVGATVEAARDPRFDKGPMNFDRYAAMSGSGGLLCYGHPYGPFGEGEDLEPLTDRSKGLVAREFPIDLALGMPCGIDLLAMEGPRNMLERKLRDLYRLWNLGFRPVVTASTDFHVDQGRQPIGSVRTYVHADTLEMPAIARGYRAGHTFVTSGPLLDLRVAGARPGDEVRVSGKKESLRVEVEAVSIGQLDRVEIILNGKVFQTFSCVEPHRINGKCEVTGDQSLWIAARAYGREDRHLANQLEGRALGAPQFAHTTPVYVGQPILAAQARDAEYFARWCDAAAKARTESEPVVSERLARARKVFTDLAERLGEVK